MTGTMISARPRLLIKGTFLKHFALKVWVSINEKFIFINTTCKNSILYDKQCTQWWSVSIQIQSIIYSKLMDKQLSAKAIICMFDLILYIPSTIFQLNRDGSSWVEPVLS